ncbi:MAG: hypothetical protein KTR20_13210 [Cellvibrionaceae bacterium]|nr:hypothetical protein [Cellvibrionaceae bacterium]
MTDLRDRFTDLWETMGNAPKSERLTLKASNNQPFVGEPVTLSWRAQGLGLEVKLFCDDVLLIDGQELQGQHTLIADDLWQKTYTAECGEARDSVTIGSRIRQPECRHLKVADKVTLGDELQVNYDFHNAQRIVVKVIAVGNDQTLESIQLSAAKGQLRLPALDVGQFKLQFVVASEHGHWAPLATITEERLFVVTHPELAITFNSSEPCIAYGNTHTLTWQLTGARAVSVHCHYGEGMSLLISEDIAASAVIRLYDDATYRLVAEAINGDIDQRELSVAVHAIPAMPSI